tara:strand:- start:21 stop:311 length:291 start_codon:yes stop_codon:yes gene_type:complete
MRLSWAYLLALFRRKIAKKPKIKMGNHAPSKGEKFDLFTKTEKILSKNINRKPKEIPNARLTPMPPLLLIEATETPIMVKTKEESGKLHRLWRTSK